MTLLMLSGLFGGLGMFIYGMHLMSEGLKIVAGSKMKQLLEKLTNTPLKALLCGIVVTMMVQSSSTTTVMVVGFVNASLMTLTQAAGIILGSNIGTTVMAQIIAFDITAYAPVFIGVGTFMALFSKKKRMRDWGSIVLGFGILFFGINTMSASVEPLNDSPEFINLLLTYGKNPIIGLLVSAAMTGILQSSGAVIGLVQALAISGVFSATSGTEAIQICIPMVIGSNIGTCVTAILSSIGTSNVAKDAALIHLFVNIFGAIWVMVLLAVLNAVTAQDPIYEWIVNISGTTTTASGQIVPNVARQIAMAHTFFNVANTIVLFPFMGRIVKLIEKILPPEPTEKGLQLDERLLNTPSVALGQVQRELTRMSKLASKNFERAMNSLITLDEHKAQKVFEKEDKIDEFEHGIQDYVTRVSNLNMSQHQNDRVTFYIETAHTIERIGDHADNLAEMTLSMIDKQAQFTTKMKNEMQGFKERLSVMLAQVTEILKDPESPLVNDILKEEESVDALTKTLKNSVIKNADESSQIFPSFVFVDMLSNLERISDMAEDVATATITLNASRETNKLNEVIY